MLNQGVVYATIAVSDIVAGKAFYSDTLGLMLVDENPGGIMYESGGGKLFVYQSAYAGTNQATCASWLVDDVEAVVNDLKSKGVTFEHYDMPDVTLEGDIHIWQGAGKAAWFKDPDGNILNVANMH